MRLAWIRDNYMFDKKAPDRNRHRYALYWDKQTKRYRAVQLTHLYQADKKRFDQLRKKQLLKMKFPGFELPSGVKDSYCDRAVTGKPLDLKHPAVQGLTKRHLPKATAKKIKSFAKRRW